MLKLPRIQRFILRQRAYTILEMLVVLAIVGMLLTMMVYGVVQFRRSIIISNTTKELVLQLGKARRYAINNTMTSSGGIPQGYYIEITNNDYRWGECIDTGAATPQCTTVSSLKSAQYGSIIVNNCNGNTIIKFNAVTGEFVITNRSTDITATPNITCRIIVESSSGIFYSRKEIEVSGMSRTIKLL